jgi:small subunit ribosomal protein S9
VDGLAKNLSYGTGRRKTAIARVFLREGNGKITVNGKTPEEYFLTDLVAQNMRRPLQVTDNSSRFDLLITVSGGGQSGQSDACKHGIARALVAYDGSNRSALRASGFLTRDYRMVERKKYGQRGARRRFQFSKR